MYKIGTHDSATGERGKGLVSFLLTLFVKTQSKSIKEQYDAGCRLFDIRVRCINGEWRCAHGLWESKRTAIDILSEINNFRDCCIVTITLEDKIRDGKQLNEFIEFISDIKVRLTNIVWGNVSVKYGKNSNLFKVKYDIIYKSEILYSVEQGFLPLDGRSWHIYLPIPILWKKIYNDKPIFNENTYIVVDFL